MSFIPESLAELGTFWTRKGGVNLGVIGNQKHCGGYHLGKDRIFSDCACKPDGTCEPGQRWADYSVNLTRDKNGLTNAASAIDLGRLGGELTSLYAFSRWLVAQCSQKKAGWSDVREIIYSPDGRHVQRWSGVDGQIHTGPGNGDLSHLTHTHISYFRDSENRDKRPLFAPYWELPDTSEDTVIVSTIERYPEGPRAARGATVTGYLLDGTTKTEQDWSGLVGGIATITRSDNAAPKGSGWVIGASRPFTNYYIPAGSLHIDPAPAPDCGDQIAAQRERDRAAVIEGVEEVFAA